MTERAEQRCARLYPPRRYRGEARTGTEATNAVPMRMPEDKPEDANADANRALNIVGILKKLINEGDCRPFQAPDGSNVLGFVVPFGADVYIVEQIRDCSE